MSDYIGSVSPEHYYKPTKSHVNGIKYFYNREVDGEHPEPYGSTNIFFDGKYEKPAMREPEKKEPQNVPWAAVRSDNESNNAG